MNFSEALTKLKEKKFLTRNNTKWKKTNTFLYIPNIRCFCSIFNLYCNCGIHDTIYYHTRSKASPDWPPDTECLFAEDWMILEPREKYLYPKREEEDYGVE